MHKSYIKLHYQKTETVINMNNSANDKWQYQLQSKLCWIRGCQPPLCQAFIAKPPCPA